MSHAFAGVLTCGHIHSIELDRELFVNNSLSSILNIRFRVTRHSGWRWSNTYIGWHIVDHTSRWLPGLVAYRRCAHCLRFRHKCKQNSKFGSGGVLSFHSLVGTTQLAVSFFLSRRTIFSNLAVIEHGFLSLACLGWSCCFGLWLVVWHYAISYVAFKSFCILAHWFCLGTLYWCHVMSVCSLGRNW
jgi:hypothetical protein